MYGLHAVEMDISTYCGKGEWILLAGVPNCASEILSLFSGKVTSYKALVQLSPDMLVNFKEQRWLQQRVLEGRRASGLEDGQHTWQPVG